MHCTIVHRNLFAYREKGLQPGVLEEFEAHLSGCEACRHLVAGFESMEGVFEKARKFEPDPFLATRTIQYLENNLGHRSNARRYALRPILVTLTAIGAIFLGYTIGKSGSERMNTPGENVSQIESLKTDLYIHDFVDESNTILINE
jgi:predicted anti-sigma-YlaC factor YlaD